MLVQLGLDLEELVLELMKRLGLEEGLDLEALRLAERRFAELDEADPSGCFFWKKPRMSRFFTVMSRSTPRS